METRRRFVSNSATFLEFILHLITTHTFMDATDKVSPELMRVWCADGDKHPSQCERRHHLG